MIQGGFNMSDETLVFCMQEAEEGLSGAQDPIEMLISISNQLLAVAGFKLDDIDIEKAATDLEAVLYE